MKKLPALSTSPRLIRFLLLLITAALLATEASATLTQQSYSAKDHQRFYTGVDKTFIGDPYDSSGVGRGTTDQWGTMISDHYFLSANHSHPGTGATVRFFQDNDPAGVSEDHVVASGTQIAGSDLWLGRLTTAPTSSINRYPILSFANTSDYDNIELFNYGKDNFTSPISQRLGRNNLDPGTIGPQLVGATTGEAYRFDFDNPGGVGADETRLAGGDSGGPSFSVIDDEFAIVGIHWFIYTEDDELGGIGSGDTFVPHYIANLNTEMAALGESVTVVGVPEPTPLFILLGILFLSSSQRRKARLRTTFAAL